MLTLTGTRFLGKGLVSVVPLNGTTRALYNASLPGSAFFECTAVVVLSDTTAQCLSYSGAGQGIAIGIVVCGFVTADGYANAMDCSTVQPSVRQNIITMQVSAVAHGM